MQSGLSCTRYPKTSTLVNIAHPFHLPQYCPTWPLLCGDTGMRGGPPSRQCPSPCSLGIESGIASTQHMICWNDGLNVGPLYSGIIGWSSVSWPCLWRLIMTATMQPVAKLRHSRTQRALSHPGSGVNFPQPGNRVHVVLGSILLDKYYVLCVYLPELPG